jgi:hypothetical protein
MTWAASLQRRARSPHAAWALAPCRRSPPTAWRRRAAGWCARRTSRLRRRARGAHAARHVGRERQRGFHTGSTHAPTTRWRDRAAQPRRGDAAPWRGAQRWWAPPACGTAQLRRRQRRSAVVRETIPQRKATARASPAGPARCVSARAQSPRERPPPVQHPCRAPRAEPRARRAVPRRGGPPPLVGALRACATRDESAQQATKPRDDDDACTRHVQQRRCSRRAAGHAPLSTTWRPERRGAEVAGRQSSALVDGYFPLRHRLSACGSGDSGALVRQRYRVRRAHTGSREQRPTEVVCLVPTVSPQPPRTHARHRQSVVDDGSCDLPAWQQIYILTPATHGAQLLRDSR